MSLTRRSAALPALALVAAVALTGCGSSSGPTSTRGGRGGGFTMSPAQQKKIARCLRAAGLSSALPTGRPSGFTTGVPSGAPSGFPSGGQRSLVTTGPSGGSSGAPSGGSSGAPSGAPAGGRFVGDPQVQAALKACGITLPSAPTRRPGAGG